MRREATLRPVTILFCDIKDSTKLISRLHSEAALKVLSTATYAMAAAVQAAGGTVLKRLGDGVMAAFGVPVAQPDHALRASRAALEIVGKVALAFADNADIQRHHPQIRIGLNSGEVAFSMEHPSAGQTDLDIIGDQVSLAARVESAALPDTVYMTEATYQRVRGAVKAEFVGLRKLDGFTTPIALYRLWAVTGPVHAMVDAPLRFVGRASELAEIRQHIARLGDGYGGMVFISGEPGIGKTRLLDEIRQGAASSELTWLRAGSPPLSENIAYWAFGEILRALLGTQGPQGKPPDWETILGIVEAILGTDDTELAPGEAAAFLGRVVHIEVPEPWIGRLAAMDGDAAYRQTLRVWWRLFDALAAQCPVVLEFDDLQWIDPASAGVIAHLLPLVRERPIAIIGCGRTDQEPPIARLVGAAREALGPRFQHQPLHRLRDAEAMDILADTLGANPESAAVRRLVLDKSEGNPFFIEEIIRALKQMELVVHAGNGGWMLACPVDEIRLPESLQELILARVDRLDEGMREVVRVAAVIGRQFLYRVLATVSTHSLGLDEKVSALQRQELIDCMHQFPELEYIFKHAVVQETIYASLFEERRRQIHRSVANCLESLFSAELDEFYAVLAYHYVRAEDWAKAQRYLFLAADQADRLAADENVFHNFENALAILDKQGERKLAPLEIATIRRKLGNIQYRRGDFEASQVQYHEGLRQLDVLEPRTRAGVRSRLVLELVHHLISRLRQHGRLPNQSTMPDREREIFALFEGLAWTYYHQDQERMLLGLLRGLNLAERYGSREGIAKGYAALAYVLNILGAYRLAAGYQERSLASARAADSPACIGLAENVIGLHYLYQGRLAEARNHYDQSQQHARNAGDWFTWSSVRMQSALVALIEGDAPHAFAIASEMIAQGREVALAPGISWGHLARGRALHLMRDPERARSDVLEAIGRASSTSDYQCLVHAEGTLALMLVEMDDFDGSRQHAAVAVALAEQRGLVGHNTTDAFNAFAAIGAHDLERASSDERATRLRAARRHCRRAMTSAAKYRPALPAALRVTATVEWLSGQRTEAIRRWHESAGLAEAIGAKFELAATLRENGIRADDVTLRDRANEVLATTKQPVGDMKTGS